MSVIDTYVLELSHHRDERENTIIALTPRYKARWDFAMHMYTKHILKAMLDPTIIVIYDGMILDEGARININTARKEITLIDKCISYMLFNGNPEYDEGAHDTLTKIEKDIKENFIFCKKIDW